MVFSSDYRPLPDRIIEFRLISYRKLSTRECWRFPDATTTTRRCQDCWLNVRSVSFPCHRVFYISHRWVDGFSTFHSFGVSTHYLFPMLAYGFEPTTTTITPPARSCRSNRCFFSFFCFVSFFFFFSNFLPSFSVFFPHFCWFFPCPDVTSFDREKATKPVFEKLPFAAPEKSYRQRNPIRIRYLKQAVRIK